MYDHPIPSELIRSHDYPTRRHDELLPLAARLTLTQNSMLVVGPKIWNTIPAEIKNSPCRNSFKLI